MKDVSTVSITVNHKRTRKVTKKDRFYIVEVEIESIFDRVTMGYFEESFNEAEFLKCCTFKDVKKVTVIKEFDNEKDYKKYRKDNDL